MFLFRIISMTLLLQCIATAVNAHEYWIEPQRYQLSEDQSLVADTRVGQMFDGASFAYSASRIVWRRLADADGLHDLPGRDGDSPAIQRAKLQPGLNILAMQTFPSSLSYASWDNFARFLNNEGLEWVHQAHRDRKLPQTGFVEIYSRFSKSLIQVGSGDGEDRAIGLDFEWVALTNPYKVNTENPVILQLSLRGIPQPDILVSIFNKQPGQTVAPKRTTLRTDSDGRIALPVDSGGYFLVSAIHMDAINADEQNGLLRIDPNGPAIDGDTRPAKKIKPRVLPPGTAWHSLWASITFAVPTPE